MICIQAKLDPQAAAEALAEGYLKKIDGMGGMVRAIEQGYPPQEIQSAAYAAQRAQEDSTAVVVTSDHGRAETDYDTPLSSILDTVDGLDYVQAGFFVYLR